MLENQKRRMAIGGIYKGARFNADSASNLTQAAFHERWSDSSDIMVWQALNDEAEASVRRLKSESDARKINEIEACLLPLRKQYTTLQTRRDRAGLAALEQAVLRALQTPVRKNETVS